MSRCSACNAAAFQRISHEEAAPHVTERLLELVQEFWQCGKVSVCGVTALVLADRLHGVATRCRKRLSGTLESAAELDSVKPATGACALHP
jgi:hypothetical protein